MYLDFNNVDDLVSYFDEVLKRMDLIQAMDR